MGQNEDLEEKKLLGSGGYVLAKLTEQEELKASLGVPQIFLANIDRLNEDKPMNGSIIYLTNTFKNSNTHVVPDILQALILYN